MPHNYRIGISRVRNTEIAEQRLNLGWIDAWNIDAWNVVFSNIKVKPCFQVSRFKCLVFISNKHETAQAHF